MTNSNDVIKIDTPENVTFDYDVAGIGSRFLAALADTTIMVLIQALVLGTTLMFFRTLAGADTVFSWTAAILGLLGFVLWWGYYVFFEILWNGQSPGKRIIGLRVIRFDGTPISSSEAIIRNLVRLIDFLPVAYGVGVVTMFLNSNSRRVGDLTAGTVVVHDRQIESLQESARGLRGVVGTLGSESDLPENFPLEKLSQHDLQVIEELFLRWNDLSNRRELAQHVLEAIVKRLDFPRDAIQFERADRILSALYKARHTRTSE